VLGLCVQPLDLIGAEVLRIDLRNSQLGDLSDPVDVRHGGRMTISNAEVKEGLQGG
jgi:hypothetical protein